MTKNNVMLSVAKHLMRSFAYAQDDGCGNSKQNQNPHHSKKSSQ